MVIWHPFWYCLVNDKSCMLQVLQEYLFSCLLIKRWMTMGKKFNTIGQRKENLQWTTSMDAFFIEAMLYEQNQGNRPDGTFTSAAYSNMLKFLHEKLDMPNLKKEHLKNRIKTLKENFTECYDLFHNKSSVGFSWSPVTKLWTAKQEVWKTFLESKPNAARWMTKPIHNYDALKELFTKETPTVEGAEKAKKKRKRLDKSNENEVTVDDIDNLVFQNFISSENFVDLDGIGGTNPAEKFEAQSQSGATSELNRRRVSIDNATEENVPILAIERFANMINECNKQIINAFTSVTVAMSNAIAASQQRAYSPSEIYAELVRMKLELPFLDEAYFWLADNEKMVRLLFGFPPERRKEALENMMKNASKGR